MTFFKRILASFLAVVICISLFISPVLAAWYNDAAYIYTQSGFLNWIVDSILVGGGSAAGGIIGAGAGTIVLPGGGTVSGAALGTAIGTGAGLAGKDAFDAFMKYLAQDSSFVSEDEYIKLLPAVEISSDGELIVPCFHIQFFTGFDSDCGHSIDSDNNLTFRPDSYNKDEFYYDCDNNSITFLKDFSGMVSIVWAFIPLEAGTYYNVWPVVSPGTAWDYPVVVDEDSVGEIYVVGGTNQIPVSRNAGETLNLSPCYMTYGAPSVDLEEDELYGYFTRPSSFTQYIYNYNNSGDGDTKFGIGVVDDRGDITNVYDVNIFDEKTLTFTEPITGNQYLCTRWTYNYESHTYHLELTEKSMSMEDSSGSLVWVTDVDVTYGDEALTISYWSGSTLIRVDSFVYVTAKKGEDPSPDSSPDPSPDPSPDSSPDPSPDPSPDSSPDPSPDPSPDSSPDPGGDDDEGWLSWLGGLFRSLISAIVNGLASGLEYLVETIVVTVVDLTVQVTGWAFDLLHVEHLTTWFSWFDADNEVFQDEFGQGTEVDVWAYS